MLVLKGNNPRFPREPSFAMLSNRLTGTTGSFGVLPRRTSPLYLTSSGGAHRDNGRSRRKESSLATAGPEGSELLSGSKYSNRATLAGIRYKLKTLLSLTKKEVLSKNSLFSSKSTTPLYQTCSSGMWLRDGTVRSLLNK